LTMTLPIEEAMRIQQTICQIHGIAKVDIYISEEYGGVLAVPHGYPLQPQNVLEILHLH